MFNESESGTGYRPGIESGIESWVSSKLALKNWTAHKLPVGE